MKSIIRWVLMHNLYATAFMIYLITFLIVMGSWKLAFGYSHEDETICLFHSIILKAAARHKVDSALIKAIIMAESSYNPKAISKKGAKGLMQLMPKTAKCLGVTNSFDPEQNINAGTWHFRGLLNLFREDVELALAAYHAGGGKVKKYKGVPPFKGTWCYIEKVLEYYRYYQGR